MGSKNDTNELIYKTEIDSQTQKTNLQLPKGQGAGGINQKFEINRYTLQYIKQINTKNLPYRTGKYIYYLIITHNGEKLKNKTKENKKIYIYIHTHFETASLYCIPRTNINTINQLYLNKKLFRKKNQYWQSLPCLNCFSSL